MEVPARCREELGSRGDDGRFDGVFDCVFEERIIIISPSSYYFFFFLDSQALHKGETWFLWRQVVVVLLLLEVVGVVEGEVGAVFGKDDGLGLFFLGRRVSVSFFLEVFFFFLFLYWVYWCSAGDPVAQTGFPVVFVDLLFDDGREAFGVEVAAVTVGRALGGDHELLDFARRETLGVRGDVVQEVVGYV